MVKKIAIIPARGGSKRLPNKNILDFKGKPMIAWTIESAIESGLFDRVIVSTDSLQIKEVSIHFGAEVPFLRQNTADDYSPVSLATIEGLAQAELFFQEKYEVITQLMANCPLRNSQNIIQQHAFFESYKNEVSVLSGFSYGMFNPFWAHQVNDEGEVKKIFPNLYDNIRSQDLPKLLCPSGAIWISNRKRLIESQTFYSPHYKIFEISWLNAIDIDDDKDLQLAKIGYEYGKEI